MRRPRSDSKLEALSDGQKRLLCEWLLAPGLPYSKICEKLAEELHVKSSPQALSRFYNSYCLTEVSRRRSLAVSGLDELPPGKWEKATMEALKQKTFEVVASPESTPAQVKQIFSLLLKSREQNLIERKLTKRETADIPPDPG